GVPLLSIWGGTHTSAGFGPFGKGEESILEISVDELTCRPCSIYGVEVCHRGDFACLTRIKAKQVAEKIVSRI
ncbi:MAG: glycosyl transferase, partial [Flammeovirgaceae bacterium]|nr:glycosyl transferase [Flammeovirgaceae bacterium]